MNQSCGKSTPRRLGLDDYAKLREQVLRRDSWRCQFCGSMENLEVHHLEFRSHSGEDKEDNLITLCANCHSSFIDNGTGHITTFGPFQLMYDSLRGDSRTDQHDFPTRN